MIAIESLLRWLIYSALFSSVILTATGLTLRLIAAPADRLRLIIWALVACLAAPWLPGLTGWTMVELPLISGPRAIALVNTIEVRDQSFVEQSMAANSRDTMNAMHHAIVTDGTQSDNGVNSSENSKNTTSVIVQNLNSSASPIVETMAARISPIQSAPVSSDLAASGSTNLASWIVTVYLVAVALQLLWWCVGLWRRFIFRRTAAVAGSGLQAVFNQIAAPGVRRVRLLVSMHIHTPLTWGLFCPVIVVPQRFAIDLENPQLRWSLAHELSHVERRDFGALFLSKIVQVVCCYQPLAWWLGRQLILCQDFIADARAAQQTGATEDYASFLVDLAKERVQPALSATLGISDRPSRLFLRVKMLVNSTVPVSSRCTRSTALLSAAGVAILMGALSTVRLEAEDVSKPESAQTVNDTSTVFQKDKQKKTDSVQPSDPKLPGNNVITGVVVSAIDGSPVADAEVWLLPVSKATQTRTNAEGRFRFEKISSPALHHVLVRKGSLATQVEMEGLSDADPKVVKFEPVKIELVEGKRAKVVVTAQATGKPVPGARVRFSRDHRTQITDQQGVVVVEGLVSGKQDFFVDADGLARNRQLIDLSLADPMTEVNFALVPGGGVRGVVVDTSGKPMPNVRVSISSRGNTWYEDDTLETDAEGRFQFLSVSLGHSVEIRVRKKDFVSDVHKLELTAALPVHELRSVLKAKGPDDGKQKNAAVVGVVVDRQKKPIGNATVEIYNDQSYLQKKTTSDVDGNFTLRDLLPSKGRNFVHVKAKGFVELGTTVQPGTADVPEIMTITLEPSRPLHVKVVTEDGNPIKGATLRVMPSFGVPLDFETLIADESGEFTLDSLPEKVTLEASLKGYHSVDVTISTLTQTEPVILTLLQEAVIRGKVTDADTGKAVPQFKVSLKGFSQVQQPPGFSALKGGPGDWWLQGETFLSQQEFVLIKCYPGMVVDLFIEAPGYDRLMVPEVVAKRPNDATAFEAKLKKRDPKTLTTVTGQMLDHAGRPVPGAALRLIASTTPPVGPKDLPRFWWHVQNGQIQHFRPCEEFRSSTTDATGRFEFKELKPDLNLQVVYWGQGVPMGRWLGLNSIGEGKTENILIRLHQPVKVTGKIDRGLFKNANSVRAMLIPDKYPFDQIHLTEGQETFEFAALPPGEYRIEIESRVGSVIWKPDDRVLHRPVLAKRLVTADAGKSYDLQFLKLDPIEPGHTRVSTDKDKVTIEGTLEVGSELVLMIGEEKDNLIWTDSSMKGGPFTAVVERSDEIKLDGGKLGSGIISRTSIGTTRSQSNIYIPETGPLPSGQFVLRDNGDYSYKEERTSFAYLRQSGEKRIPISIFIRKSK